MLCIKYSTLYTKKYIQYIILVAPLFQTQCIRPYQNSSSNNDADADADENDDDDQDIDINIKHRLQPHVFPTLMTVPMPPTKQ